ncbi:MAG: signal recognition particle protein, partial [Corynebacterium casei]
PKNSNRGGGMPQMPGGMPGGGGMPSMEELQKLQEQMGSGGAGGGTPGMGNKLPKGMENIDLNNLKFDK